MSPPAAVASIFPPIAAQSLVTTESAMPSVTALACLRVFLGLGQPRRPGSAVSRSPSTRLACQLQAHALLHSAISRRRFGRTWISTAWHAERDVAAALPGLLFSCQGELQGGTRHATVGLANSVTPPLGASAALRCPTDEVDATCVAGRLRRLRSRPPWYGGIWPFQCC